MKSGRIAGLRGFTLFEVMMALGIFGIAVVGMMIALNSALEAASEARDDQNVRTELENRIALLESEPLAELQRTVELKTPKVQFVETIRRESVTAPDNTVLDGFWRVSVLAKWDQSSHERMEEASFLRFGP